MPISRFFKWKEFQVAKIPIAGSLLSSQSITKVENMTLKQVLDKNEQIFSIGYIFLLFPEY